MEVVIVARTKMGASRCIGAITPKGESLRLLQPGLRNWDSNSPFHVGDVWKLDVTPANSPTPPHVEDVVVGSGSKTGVVSDLNQYLRNLVKPWAGDVSSLFDGFLRFTNSSNGYIAKSVGIPSRSTWFWLPNKDLVLREDGKHYDYKALLYSRGFSYVGEQAAIRVVPAGTLTRISLARWWKPDNVEDLELRCYAQLSGWY